MILVVVMGWRSLRMNALHFFKEESRAFFLERGFGVEEVEEVERPKSGW